MRYLIGLLNVTTNEQLAQRLNALPDCYDDFVECVVIDMDYYDLAEETLAMLDNTPGATTRTVLEFVLFMTGGAPVDSYEGFSQLT